MADDEVGPDVGPGLERAVHAVGVPGLILEGARTVVRRLRRAAAHVVGDHLDRAAGRDLALGDECAAVAPRADEPVGDVAELGGVVLVDEEDVHSDNPPVAPVPPYPVAAVPDPQPRSQELFDLLALTLVEGVGPMRVRALLEHFGSASAARAASAEALAGAEGIGPKLAFQLARGVSDRFIERELEIASAAGVRLVALGSPEYPALLAEIPDPPPLLYVRGDLPASDGRAVAIVGSRKCSPYGRRFARQLARDLAARGYASVSGLAYGIDAEAHHGSLEGGGRTFAVMAGGLSSIYPAEHAGLADAVAAGGALVSESPMTLKPERGTFVHRNRLICGLARGVVIVEAGDPSGTMATARHAAEQGREVFAVPGEVGREQSAGCLRLIRDGARLIRGIDDLMEDLAGIKTPAPAPVPLVSRAPAPPPVAPPPPSLPPAPPTPRLDAAQQAIWDALAEPLSLDELIRRLGVGAGEVQRTLMRLEMSRLVRRRPGGMLERG